MEGQRSFSQATNIYGAACETALTDATGWVSHGPCSPDAGEMIHSTRGLVEFFRREEITIVPAAHVGTEKKGKRSGLGRLSHGRRPEEDGASQEIQRIMQRCGVTPPPVEH